MISVTSFRETIAGLKEASDYRGVPLSQLAIYLDLLEHQERCFDIIEFSVLDKDDLKNRWDRGLIALDDQLNIKDLALADELFNALSEIFIRHLPDYADEIRNAIGDNSSYFSMTIDTCMEPASEEIGFLIAHTLHPFMVRLAHTIKDCGVEPERWIEPYCPICGGSADMASLSKENGARTLLCSQCDCEWPYQRIGCPYCRIQNSEAIQYYADDHSPYRLYLCNSCRKYLKTIDRREVEKQFPLTVERWLSQSLDIAGKKIYKAQETS